MGRQNQKPQFFLLPASLLCTMLIGWLVLMACGEDITPNSPTKQSSAAFTPSPARTNSGPLFGPDGQITVVAPPANGRDLTGLFVWVNQSDIWLGGTSGQGKSVSQTGLGGRAITAVEPLGQATSPVLSPDGTQILYAYSPPPSGPIGQLLIGQDLWLYNLKTNENKLLVKRNDPQGFLDDPAWSVDGKTIYYAYRIPQTDENGVALVSKTGLESYDLSSGRRQKLVENGRYPAPTPDGKRVVYVSIDSNGNTLLNVLDLSNNKTRTLLGLTQGFVSYAAPRPSPDGTQIVFSGGIGPEGFGELQPTPTAAPKAGLDDKIERALGATNSGAGRTGLSLTHFNSWRLAPVPMPQAHGLPYDLWIINIDGTGMRRLTTLYEDQPIPAWSKNGQQVAFLTGLALYTVDANGQNLMKRVDRGSHGGFDWKDQF